MSGVQRNSYVANKQTNRMYKIEIPKTIHQLMEIFYRLGMWSDNNVTTFGEFCRKLFYLIFYVIFVLSIAIGAYSTDDRDESVFLTVLSVISAVQTYRMWYILWGRNEFLLLVNQIGTYSTYDRKEFSEIKNKLNVLMTFVRFVLLAFIIAAFFAVVLFPITNEKHLIFNIAFPFDYNNSDVGLWMAAVYLSGGFFCATVCDIITKMVWYLMLSISLEYKVFGGQLRHMGTSIRTSTSHLKVSLAAQQQLFYDDFIVANQTYDKLNGCSHLFLLALQHKIMIKISDLGR